ncbi:tRNA lysidine(34) synthetase TilS [Bordetella sp. 02P26C-1]|nr:tRNA lysidine(34) synthetase TilS [Bordetella sp. 02P26C-1]
MFPQPDLIAALRRGWPGAVKSAGEKSTLHLAADSIPSGECVAVATSGGADSAMLAAHASLIARERGAPIILFHVHHGLQVAADGWADHVQALGKTLGVRVATAYAQVENDSGLGIEAAARDARYSALSELAQRHDVRHILLAHHQNDQAETVLLRLLRGTGPEGMAAMAPSMQRDGITYHRPWLDQSRARILQAAQAFAQQYLWHAVQDPTNADPRYTRAAVRELLTPVLDVRWPGWQKRLSSHARHAAESNSILDEVAQSDFAGLQPSPDGISFSLAQWRSLSPARQSLALRYWLRRNGARMPTEARLADLLRQLRQLHSLGHDRHMKVAHGDHVVQCHRGRVWIEPRTDA